MIQYAKQPKKSPGGMSLFLLYERLFLIFWFQDLTRTKWKGKILDCAPNNVIPGYGTSENAVI